MSLPILFDCYQRLSSEEVASYLTSGGFTEIPVQREESTTPEHPHIQASAELPVSTDGSNDWTADFAVEEGAFFPTSDGSLRNEIIFRFDGGPGGSRTSGRVGVISLFAVRQAANSSLPDLIPVEDLHVSRVLIGDANGDHMNDMLVVLSNGRGDWADGQGILFLGGSCVFSDLP